jgi:DNA-binding NarL/FixJ family response regulator
MPHNVLIVDDSADVRHVVRAFLERDTAFAVCGEAPDGLEAIKKAQELKPDLVLLDLSMPGMNGIETAMVLRRLLPKTHIVLFSNYTDQLGTTLASAVGIDLVLSKGSLTDMAKSLKSLPPRKWFPPIKPSETTI